MRRVSGLQKHIRPVPAAGYALSVVCTHIGTPVPFNDVELLCASKRALDTGFGARDRVRVSRLDDAEQVLAYIPASHCAARTVRKRVARIY